MDTLTRKRNSTTQNHTKYKKKSKTSKKRITFHHNVKEYNGKNSIPREKIRYKPNHIFPYITNSNLLKGNLWSTSKNRMNAINNLKKTLSNKESINEERYLRKHKRLPPSYAYLAKLSPAEFAHRKAKWIERNILNTRRANKIVAE